jgi:hypothetical protein
VAFAGYLHRRAASLRRAIHLMHSSRSCNNSMSATDVKRPLIRH